METLIITKAQLIEAVNRHVADKLQRARLTPVRSIAAQTLKIGTLGAADIIELLTDFVENQPHK